MSQYIKLFMKQTNQLKELVFYAFTEELVKHLENQENKAQEYLNAYVELSERIWKTKRSITIQNI